MSINSADLETLQYVIELRAEVKQLKAKNLELTKALAQAGDHIRNLQRNPLYKVAMGYIAACENKLVMQ